METTCGCHHIIKLSEENLPAFKGSQILKRIWEAGGQVRFDKELFELTSQTLLKGFKKGWDQDSSVTQNEVKNLMNEASYLKLTDGFEYGIDDPGLLTAFEQNLFRFSAAKTLAQVQELNALFRQSDSFQAFFEKASARFDIFNKTWLETEYNTAILTGEAAATYHRLIAKSDLFPYWEYRTVGDEHVRAEHQKLHGLILPFDDPRWDKLFPPNGWNCRCFILPRMASEVNASKIAAMRKRADRYFKSKEFKFNQAQGWGVNRGKSGEIFTANQQYVYKQPGKAASLLNSLTPADYGLPSYSKAKKVAKSVLPTYDGKPGAFYNVLSVVDGNAVVRDYNSRPLALQPTDKVKEVTQLKAMNDTISQPDEVWINGTQGGKELDNLIYIRYYQDKTMVVVGDIQNGNASAVKSWFTLTERKQVIDQYRRGILIK